MPTTQNAKTPQPKQDDNSLFEDFVAGVFRFYARHWGWTVPVTCVLLALFATRDWKVGFLLWFLAFGVVALRLFLPKRRARANRGWVAHLDPRDQNIALHYLMSWARDAERAGLAIESYDAGGEVVISVPEIVGTLSTPAGLVVAVRPIPGRQSINDLVLAAPRLQTAWHAAGGLQSEVDGLVVRYTVLLGDPLAGTRHAGDQGAPPAPAPREEPHW